MTSPRIAVVGAGIGGLTCARTLQRHGRQVTVFERETSAHARRQGGMLDLHVDTGQAALRAAGLFAEFGALARPEGQELRGLDPFTGELIFHEHPTDGPGNAPEIDRGQLRGLFLESLAPGTVRWGRPAAGVTPTGDGTARLRFADGTTEEFDLVVGADGAWSRIRPALSDARPAYLGDTIVETRLDDADTRHPASARLIGNGTMVAKSGRTMLSAQRNSGGHIRVYAMLEVPRDWHVAAGVDLDDDAAVRRHLLAVFDGWHDSLLDLIRDSDGGFANRPLHVLPVGHTWDHVPGVTLLGDAAHLMPPAGIGANLAMLDGADLAEAVVVHDGLDEAVRAYENRMLPRAAAGARACADLTAGLVADMVVSANAARRYLNERLQAARPTG
ncbi:FAD-dependent oxidoreductase [Nonomuraea roseoviolacea]|uniref:Flavin-dependent monooxygenase n=1 Tax=Nonomuraea roseoviolacea subsp. carminata TaxID=160689 RepID=A0ABT1KCC4_9ACTN|nr:NAD(P)/FAD-dependent oxidoreductase [Nonomuraea roseoviolacea]MCP2351327.1 2-polyprenyl-6-methoxyphenol hydroxylase-like FAD-dependent oxidoreductase [Nonomuraea roseoviolacea subsp. carminata]